MLDATVYRKKKLGLSTRRLAAQLDISPTLLSLVLNGKRGVSQDLADRMARWLATPMASGGPKHPSTVYKAFMAERASFVSVETIRYYREQNTDSNDDQAHNDNDYHNSVDRNQVHACCAIGFSAELARIAV